MKKTIHSENGKIIAKTVTHIRKNAGLTQRALAQKLKREHSFVAHCELGERRIDLAEFYWICKACNTNPSEEAVKLMTAFENQKQNSLVPRSSSLFTYSLNETGRTIEE